MSKFKFVEMMLPEGVNPKLRTTPEKVWEQVLALEHVPPGFMFNVEANPDLAGLDKVTTGVLRTSYLSRWADWARLVINRPGEDTFRVQFATWEDVNSVDDSTENLRKRWLTLGRSVIFEREELLAMLEECY